VVEEIWIKGPQGRIQAHWRPSAQDRSKALLLCHPHPQFGGTMNDRVLAECDDVAFGMGISSLKFNFAGVGASEGVVGGIDAAAADVKAAAAVLDRNGDEGWWMGYSFGAVAALSALASDVPASKPKGVILVAPALSLLPDLPVLPGDIPFFVISGTEDQFVSPETLTGYFGASSVALIEGADHFFSGYDEILSKTMYRLLSGT